MERSELIVGIAIVALSVWLIVYRKYAGDPKVNKALKIAIFAIVVVLALLLIGLFV